MKHKNILVIFSGFTAVAVILRTLQLMFLIEHSTGFDKNNANNGYIAIAIYALYFVFAIGTYVLVNFFSKIQPSSRPEIEKSPFLAAVSLVLSAFLLISSASTVVFSDFTENMASNTLSLLTGLFSFLFFLLYGMGKWAKIKLPSGFTVAPIIYFVYRLVISFINYTGVTNISENILDIIFLCLALLFFLLHGKILSGIEVRKSCRQILSLGLLTFFFGCLNSLPPILTVALGFESELHSMPSFGTLEYLLFGIYALTFTLYLYGNNSRTAVECRKGESCESEELPNESHPESRDDTEE